MIRRRALRMLSAACLASVLAWQRPPPKTPPWLPRASMCWPRIRRFQNVVEQSVANLDVTAYGQGDPGRRRCGLKPLDIKSLTQALDNVADSSDQASPAKLFRWAVGDPDLGQSLDEPVDLDGDDIETDRPDFTQNRKTVGRGVVQLEQGMTYLQGRTIRTTTSRFPKRCCAMGIDRRLVGIAIEPEFCQ